MLNGRLLKSQRLCHKRCPFKGELDRLDFILKENCLVLRHPTCPFRPPRLWLRVLKEALLGSCSRSYRHSSFSKRRVPIEMAKMDLPELRGCVIFAFRKWAPLVVPLPQKHAPVLPLLLLESLVLVPFLIDLSECRIYRFIKTTSLKKNELVHDVLSSIGELRRKNFRKVPLNKSKNKDMSNGR